MNYTELQMNYNELHELQRTTMNNNKQQMNYK
jgi:hypothetical protein